MAREELDSVGEYWGFQYLVYLLNIYKVPDTVIVAELDSFFILKCELYACYR